MNPRHRRLIIPGLLIGLLVVVIVAALIRDADAAEEQADDAPVVVSTLSDPRIVESSGLAVSAIHDDLAYTVNDSGHDPLVFAVRISTGETVGVTTLDVDWLDVEALGLGPDGTLWVADIGDNRANRDEIRLYALAEPGEGDSAVSPDVYRLQYPDGPVDAEAVAVDPRDGTMHILTKEAPAGGVYTVPDDARPDEVATLIAGPRFLPTFVTDASFHPDGASVAVRTYFTVHDFDPETWTSRASAFLPPQPQGETIAFEAGGDTFLIGSEGADSSLIRIDWTQFDDVRDPGPIVETVDPDEHSDAVIGEASPYWIWILALLGFGSMLLVAFIWNRRR